MNAEEKLAAIRARIDLLQDEDADRHGASSGYAIEDIGRILEGQTPMSVAGPRCGEVTVFWPDVEACDAVCVRAENHEGDHRDEILGYWGRED